jgi:peptidylprolyl isomerase
MHNYEMREGSSENGDPGEGNTSANDLAERRMLAEKFPETVVEMNGIRYRVLREGEGAKPIAGSRVKAHYEGRLLDGTVFDSSYKRDKPFEFRLLAGDVIRGWDDSIIEMRKGEKRLIVVPSDLAYGERGRPPIIPPRAPLVFEIELVDFE